MPPESWAYPASYPCALEISRCVGCGRVYGRAQFRFQSVCSLIGRCVRRHDGVHRRARSRGPPWHRWHHQPTGTAPSLTELRPTITSSTAPDHPTTLSWTVRSPDDRLRHPEFRRLIARSLPASASASALPGASQHGLAVPGNHLGAPPPLTEAWDPVRKGERGGAVRRSRSGRARPRGSPRSGRRPARRRGRRGSRPARVPARPRRPTRRGRGPRPAAFR